MMKKISRRSFLQCGALEKGDIPAFAGVFRRSGPAGDEAPGRHGGRGGAGEVRRGLGARLLPAAALLRLRGRGG